MGITKGDEKQEREGRRTKTSENGEKLVILVSPFRLTSSTCPVNWMLLKQIYGKHNECEREKNILRDFAFCALVLSLSFASLRFQMRASSVLFTTSMEVEVERRRRVTLTFACDFAICACAKLRITESVIIINTPFGSVRSNSKRIRISMHRMYSAFRRGSAVVSCLIVKQKNFVEFSVHKIFVSRIFLSPAFVFVICISFIKLSWWSVGFEMQHVVVIRFRFSVFLMDVFIFRWQ